MKPSRLALAAGIALLLGACDPPTDLGQPCTLRDLQGNVWTSAVSVNDDYYDQGTTECQDFVCLRPAASPLDAGLGICSNNCTPSDSSNPNSSSADCNGASMPMVCRAVAMDQKFLDSLDAGLLEQYLGGTTAPVLCTTPIVVNQ